MGKEIKASWVDGQGYVRVTYDDLSLAAEHRLVWEAANGPIPPGYQIHHLNHDRADNRLENLECVDPQTHKRRHVGHRFAGGIWFKSCTRCGWEGPETDFPTKCYRDGKRMTRGNCRECDRERQRRQKGWAGSESPIYGRRHGPYKD